MSALEKWRAPRLRVSAGARRGVTQVQLSGLNEARSAARRLISSYRTSRHAAKMRAQVRSGRRQIERARMSGQCRLIDTNFFERTDMPDRERTVHA